MASVFSAKEPIRILRLFSRLNIGGPSIHVVLLASGLRDRGYETLLAVGHEAPEEGNLLAWAREQGVECTRIDGLGREVHLLSDLRSWWSLCRLVRRFRPAVVHTHTAKAGVLGRLAARAMGVPVVVHTFHGHVLHGYFGALKSAVFRLAECVLAPLTSTLVTVSESVRDDLVSMGIARAHHIKVIPLGLELGRLTGRLPRGALRAAGVPLASPLIGCVGRLVPIKDLGGFLEAAARVRTEIPEAHFALVGDGPQREELEKRARELGIAEVVHFYGWRQDMEEVYGDLDVVVNCSLNEGTPVALIEALAAGRPIVATRVGGTPDVLGENRHGLLVPARDSRALALAVVEVLRRPEAARARALAGQRDVVSRFAKERLLNDVDALYRELLPTAAGGV